MNFFMLYGEQSPFYATFLQAKTLGGHVKKGAKGFPVFFASWNKRENKETGKEESFPIFRYSTVFNAVDLEGVEYPKPEKRINFVAHEEGERIATSYMQNNNVKLSFGGEKAFYRPSEHSVTMPEKKYFSSNEHYYATLFHELAHSTALVLGRNERGSFGNSAYAREELTAELASSYLMAYLGMDNTCVLSNAVGYLQYWQKAIKEDGKVFASASSRAQKAVNCILGIQRQEEEND